MLCPFVASAWGEKEQGIKLPPRELWNVPEWASLQALTLAPGGVRTPGRQRRPRLRREQFLAAGPVPGAGPQSGHVSPRAQVGPARTHGAAPGPALSLHADVLTAQMQTDVSLPPHPVWCFVTPSNDPMWGCGPCLGSCWAGRGRDPSSFTPG